MDAKRLLTRTLRELPHGAQISEILAAALAAVEPAAAVRRFLRREDHALIVGSRIFDLNAFDRVLLVGVGKAGAPMAQAAADVLGGDLTEGLVVVKDEPAAPPPARVTLLAAGHPLPDQRGVAAASQIAALLDGAGERDLVLAVISGGGSALLPLPVQGVTLDEMQTLTSLLLRCGASIDEMNALRKHLEQLKGGGIARRAAPATVATLILSDVVGSPLDVIASGPTVPDSSTFASAYSILERYNLVNQAPEAIVKHLRAGMAGEIAETPKPGDPLFEKITNIVVGSNAQAAEAALEQAGRFGMHTLLLSTYIQGEAREVGRVLAGVARQLATSDAPVAKPACIVLGGETTVTLRGDGKGGRNQELALGAVADFAGVDKVVLVTLATDGGDGPTDAAGAVVTGMTLAQAQQNGLDLYAALARNDAYPFFAALDDLVRPGPTETNVNDLAFVFAW